MGFRETFRLALRAIRRNKVRSALTMLGVIIGVASVIAMIALGSGARASIDEQIQSQGTNLIFVNAGSFGRGPGAVRGGAGSISTLTAEDAQAIEQQVPTVERSSPGVRGRAQAIAGNQNWNTQVQGEDEDYVVIRNWPVASGANFTPRDVLVADKVCLLGSIVAQTLFPEQDPVGQIVRVRNLPFRVVGVLAPKGQGQFGQDQDDIIVAPYTTVQKKLLGITFLHSITMSATSAQAVEPTAVEITRLMRERHRSATPEEDDFTVRTVEEMAATRVETARTMTMLLMSVASVSLLVGGIGIMNIMLVSVTERTREIGIRLAIGAQEREVLLKFLIEAVVLAALGGLVGVVLATVASLLLTQLMSVPWVFDPIINVASFAFAAVIGVVFGYFPARRAARLDPIEALRHE